MNERANTTNQSDVPQWVRAAVLYRIIPDRFARSAADEDEAFALSDSVPNTMSVGGGSLQGIIERVPYLADLGITTVCLTPIFLAATTHHMNPSDLYQIDPLLGDRATFRRLVDTLHAAGMRLMLDIVLTRSGRGFFAFQHILEHGEQSPYVPWYIIDQLPIHPYRADGRHGYQALWDDPAMPIFNLAHPSVQQYLIGAVQFWLEEGVDGLCIDHPEPVSQPAFWAKLREAARAINPEAYLVGDVWSDGREWLDATQSHGVVNHILRTLLRDFVATGTCQADGFARKLTHLLENSHDEAHSAHLTILGNHNTPRFLTEAHHDVDRMRLAVLLQMVLPGVPCLYYGDEIGMQGGHSPLSRGRFLWTSTLWNHVLWGWVQQCIRLRREHTALQAGTYQVLLARATMNVFAFVREDQHEQVVVAVNNRAVPRVVDLPLDVLAEAGHGMWHSASSEQTWHVTNGILPDIRIGPMQAVVLYRTRD